MINQLEVKELSISCIIIVKALTSSTTPSPDCHFMIMIVTLTLAWLENTISLNCELQMEYIWVEINIFMPTSLEEGIFKTGVAFADKYFSFPAKIIPLSVKNPLQWILGVIYILGIGILVETRIGVALIARVDDSLIPQLQLVVGPHSWVLNWLWQPALSTYLILIALI